jgi:hypothetical protein
MTSRIAIFKGAFQYDVVNDFADHLGEACARHDVEPVLVDLRGPATVYASLIERLENDPATLGFVGFNGVGLAQRAGLGLGPRRHAKPCLAWLVDHPLEHLARVVELKSDTIAAVDAGHAQFLKALGLKNALCLPHAGAAPPLATPGRPWRERPIALLMPGTIADPHTLQAAAREGIESKLGPDWTKLYDELVADPRLVFDDALIEKAGRARRRAGDTQALSPALCVVMIQAIRAKRNARRLAVVRALDAAGTPVTLCGKGWENFAFTNHEALGPKTFAETRALFADARTVLHVNPLFSSALHERVVYASLAGALVASDANVLMKRTFAQGRGLIYNADDVDELAARLRALDETGEGAAVAEAGRARMLTDHTWDSRARAVIETLESNARLAA